MALLGANDKFGDLLCPGCSVGGWGREQASSAWIWIYAKRLALSSMTSLPTTLSPCQPHPTRSYLSTHSWGSTRWVSPCPAACHSNNPPHPCHPQGTTSGACERRSLRPAPTRRGQRLWQGRSTFPASTAPSCSPWLPRDSPCSPSAPAPWAVSHPRTLPGSPSLRILSPESFLTGNCWLATRGLHTGVTILVRKAPGFRKASFKIRLIKVSSIKENSRVKLTYL